MFTIRPEDCVGRTEKLLYNIFTLLQKQSKEATPINEEGFTCKQCGATFENKGKFLAHMRTHKKEAKA